MERPDYQPRLRQDLRITLGLVCLLVGILVMIVGVVIVPNKKHDLTEPTINLFTGLVEREMGRMGTLNNWNASPASPAINGLVATAATMRIQGGTIRGLHGAGVGSTVTIQNIDPQRLLVLLDEDMGNIKQDRFKLPGNANLVIPPGASATVLQLDTGWVLLGNP